jgi:secreted trypsin-like serine protease
MKHKMRILEPIAILLIAISFTHCKHTSDDNEKSLNLSDIHEVIQNTLKFVHNGLQDLVEHVKTHFSGRSEPKERTEGQRASSTRGNCKCGLTSTRSRIINGKVTKRNQYPWQVGLKLRGKRIFCGGSIISSRTIITAAHCLESDSYPVSISLLYVVVGEYDITKKDGEKEYKVYSKTVHPYYNKRNYDYDYAILTLTNDITWAHHINPVCLPNSQQYSAKYDNLKAVVTGWGTMIPHSYAVKYPDKLMEANVKTKSNAWCSKMFKYERRDITPRMLCALGHNKDSCRGDSGGPLVIKIGRKYEKFFILAGIVSWGMEICNSPGIPGVYSRVTSQLAWIKRNTKGSKCPMPHRHH